MELDSQSMKKESQQMSHGGGGQQRQQGGGSQLSIHTSTASSCLPETSRHWSIRFPDLSSYAGGAGQDFEAGGSDRSMNRGGGGKKMLQGDGRASQDRPSRMLGQQPNQRGSSSVISGSASGAAFNQSRPVEINYLSKVHTLLFCS